MTEQEIYHKALMRWGLDDQVMMAMGECGELIAALNRYYNQRRGELSEVAEEIADVEIMMGQMRLLVGSEEVDKIKQRKLGRLRRILNGEVSHPHA